MEWLFVVGEYTVTRSKDYIHWLGRGLTSLQHHSGYMRHPCKGHETGYFSSSSWSPAQEVMNDMKITDTNVPFSKWYTHSTIKKFSQMLIRGNTTTTRKEIQHHGLFETASVLKSLTCVIIEKFLSRFTLSIFQHCISCHLTLPRHHSITVSLLESLLGE